MSVKRPERASRLKVLSLITPEALEFRIGLAVVRNLVEAMGGTVRLLDARLGGARVSVTLPAFTASPGPGR